MSQHDLEIASAPGATVRGDINAALAALSGQQSGATAPSTTVAYQRWADTTNGLLWQRNAGNSAWVPVGSLDADRHLTKTTAYTLQQRDFGKTVELDTTSAAFTLTLFAVATSLEGWWCWLRGTGTGGNDATVDGNGAETIDGDATQALADGQLALLTCTGAAWTLFRVAPAAGGTPLPRSYLSGLGLANNGTDSDHDIDIAPGECRDSANALNLSVAATLTKRIDAAWAEGNGTGGFPTALTLAADTWYRVFLIGKTDGTTDAGFDTSATAANLLSDASAYSRYRQIGWVRTYAGTGPDIRPFIQAGDRFLWTDPNAIGLDESDFALSTSEQTITLDHCPPSVDGIMHAGVSGTEAAFAWVYETGITSAAVNATATMLPNVGSQNANSGQTNTHVAEIRVGVDASRQIHVRGLSTHTLDLQVIGWIDRRGRDD